MFQKRENFRKCAFAILIHNKNVILVFDINYNIFYILIFIAELYGFIESYQRREWIENLKGKCKEWVMAKPVLSSAGRIKHERAGEVSERERERERERDANPTPSKNLVTTSHNENPL